MQPSSVEHVYLAAIGVRRRVDIGTINVSGYIDEDLNGRRDEAERPLNRLEAFVTPVEGGCLLGPFYSQAVPNRGMWTYSNLPAGAWDLRVNDSYLAEADELAIPIGGNLKTLTLRAGETLQAEVGFRLAAASYVDVHTIEDLNRNGRADPGEPPVDGVLITCFEGNSDGASCSRATIDGMALIGPAVNTSYRIGVTEEATALPGDVVWGSGQPFQEAAVGEGETVSLTFLVYRL